MYQAREISKQMEGNFDLNIKTIPKSSMNATVRNLGGRP